MLTRLLSKLVKKRKDSLTIVQELKAEISMLRRIRGQLQKQLLKRPGMVVCLIFYTFMCSFAMFTSYLPNPALRIVAFTGAVCTLLLCMGYTRDAYQANFKAQRKLSRKILRLEEKIEFALAVEAA